MARSFLVVLKYLAPLLLLLLTTIAGHSATEAKPFVFGGVWYLFLFVLFVGGAVDISRGRWVTYLVFFIFLIFNIGLFLEQQSSFLAWALCIFLSLCTVILLTQARTHRVVQLLMLFISIVLAITPSVLTAGLFPADVDGYIVTIGAIAAAFWPFVFQYTFSFRAEASWPLLTIHQMLVRVGFLIWFVLWRPVLLDTNLANTFTLPIAILLALIFLLTNLFSSRVSWAHTLQTVYTLAIVLIILHLGKSENIAPYIVISLLALGTAFLGDSEREDREDVRLPFLELGGLGSGAFLLLLIILFDLRRALTSYEFILTTMAVFFVGAKVWLQCQRENSVGSRPKSRSYRKYARMAVQGLSWAVAVYCLIFLKSSGF